MTRLAALNLIHVFDFYLAAMFVVGTYRRFAQYRATAGLALPLPGRWPNLFRLVKDHPTVFMTWATLLPSLLALAVWLLNWTASRLVWHDAALTAADLWAHHLAWLIVAPLGGAMLALDTYFLIRVGTINRPEVEKYFDQ